MCMSICRQFVRILVDLTIFVAIVLLIPGIPPHYKFDSFRVAPSRKLVDELEPNHILDSSEPLLPAGQILGPESIAISAKGEIYTGLIGGQVIRLHQDRNGYTVIAKFGQDCEGKWEERICGRPLGMRLDKTDRYLYVADAYKGLYRVDLAETDDKKPNFVQLVSPQEELGGLKSMCLNDLDVSADGSSIYYSDSSTNVHLEDSVNEFLGEASGRLLRYDVKTRQSQVLISGIRFANGVQLSPDEDFVIVSETAMSRVLKYHLKGEKAGTYEVFVEGLPGSPDNIRSNGQGGFFVSLIVPRGMSLVEHLGPWPMVRKFLLRILAIAEHTLYGLDYILPPNTVIKQAIYYTGHLEPMSYLLPRQAIIVELNQRGDIIGSLQGLKGICHLSELSLDRTGRVGYLGSPYNSNIYKVNLPPRK